MMTVFWCDGKSIRSIHHSDADKVFKWILAEHGKSLILVVMPDNAGMDFHYELKRRVCDLKGWDMNTLKVLGGGVRFKDGKILHRSTFFGEMPEKYRADILRALGLKKSLDS